ncbi:MAG: hypothetical protein RLZZ628_2464 [Bacteroidota bacterium]|jgi:hypothetical protein
MDVRISRISPIRTDFFLEQMLDFKQKNKQIRTNR